MGKLPKKDKFSFLNNQSGVALLQVVTAAMIIGLSVGLIARNSDLLTKSITGAYFSEEIKIKEDILKNLLIDQEFCTSTFGGLELPLESIDTIGGGERSDGVYFPVGIAVGEKFGFNNSFEVTDLSLEHLGNNISEIEISAKLNTVSTIDQNGNFVDRRVVFGFGASTVSKKFKIFTELNDDDEVISCFYDPSAEDDENYIGDITIALNRVCRSMDSQSLSARGESDPTCSSADGLNDPNCAGSYFDIASRNCLTRGFPKSTLDDGGLTTSKICVNGQIAGGLAISGNSPREVNINCVDDFYSLRGFDCSLNSSKRYIDEDVTKNGPMLASQSGANYFIKGFRENGQVICERLNFQEISPLMDLDHATLEAQNCTDDLRLLDLNNDVISVGCSGSTPSACGTGSGQPCEAVDCQWSCDSWENSTCSDGDQLQLRNCEITQQAQFGGVSCDVNAPDVEQTVPGTCNGGFICDPGVTAAVNYNDFGTGTIDDPFQIGTAAQMSQLANLGSGDWGMNFVQCNSINLSLVSAGMQPIGNTGLPFIGQFDGNGQSISGFNSNHGLFGRLGSNGRLISINIRDSRVNCANSSCALLVDSVFGDTPVIDGITTSQSEVNAKGLSSVGMVIGSSNAIKLVLNDTVIGGEIDHDNGGSYIGGIVGFHSGGISANNLNTMNLEMRVGGSSGSVDHVGGIFGNLSINRPSTFLNFQNTSNVEVTSNSSISEVGGVFGHLYMSGGSGVVNINHIRNAGNISVVGPSIKRYIGGLAGRIGGGDASNFVHIFDSNTDSQVLRVNAGSSFYVGGFVGYATDYTFVENSLSQMDVDTQSSTSRYSGGFAGYVGDDVRMDTVISYGRVAATESSGGLIGYIDGNAQIVNSSTRGEVGCVSGCGGFSSSIIANARVNTCVAEGAVACSDGICGGFTAFASGNSEIANSSSLGAISGTRYMGGFVSRLSGTSVIRSSHASGSVSSGTQYTGGFVSSVEGSNAIVLSSASGNITGGDFTGGFAGMIWGSPAGNTMILDSLNGSQSINGREYVGGLIGYLYNQIGDYDVHVGRSYTKAQTVNASGGNSGGLIGYAYSGNESDLFIYNSFVDVIDFRATRDSGGLIGTIYPGPFTTTTNNINISGAVVSDTNFNVTDTRTFGGLIGKVEYSPNTEFRMNIIDSYSRARFVASGVMTAIDIIAGMMAYSDSLGAIKFLNTYAAVPEIVGGGASAIGSALIGTIFHQGGSGDGAGGLDSVNIENSFGASNLDGFNGGVDYLFGDQDPDLVIDQAFYSDWMDCVGAPCNGSFGGVNTPQSNFLLKTELPMTSWNFATTWKERSDNYPELRCPAGAPTEINFCTDYAIAQDIDLTLNDATETCTPWSQISSGDMNSSADNFTQSGDTGHYYRMSVRKTPNSSCVKVTGGLIEQLGVQTQMCGSPQGYAVGNAANYSLSHVSSTQYNCSYDAANASVNFTLPSGYPPGCDWEPNGTTYIVERKICGGDNSCTEFSPWQVVDSKSDNGIGSNYNYVTVDSGYFSLRVTKVPLDGSCETTVGGVTNKHGPVTKQCGPNAGEYLSATDTLNFQNVDGDQFNCSYSGANHSVDFPVPVMGGNPCTWDNTQTTYEIVRRVCTQGSGDTCVHGSWNIVANGPLTSPADSFGSPGTIDSIYRISMTKVPDLSDPDCTIGSGATAQVAGALKMFCGSPDGYAQSDQTNYEVTYQDDLTFGCEYQTTSSIQVDFPANPDSFPGCEWNDSQTTYQVEERACN